MANLNVPLPNELKVDMDAFPDINWTEVAREAIRQMLTDLKFLKEFTRDSELTEKDALELGRTVNRALASHYKV